MLDLETRQRKIAAFYARRRRASQLPTFVCKPDGVVRPLYEGDAALKPLEPRAHECEHSRGPLPALAVYCVVMVCVAWGVLAWMGVR